MGEPRGSGEPGVRVARGEPFLVRWLRAALITRVPRDHDQPDRQFHRRRVVVVATVLVGAVFLGLSLSTRPGDARFYLLTTLLALTWVVGGFASGPLHLGRIESRGELRRPAVSAIALGVLAAAVFVVGAFVVAHIGPLASLTNDVLAHARQGSLLLVTLITILNGVAEELFFRGALFAAIGRRYPVVISTLVYGLTTVATANAMLVFAALILGLVLGLERRASGGVLAPMLTHVTWSVSMLFLLPVIVPH
jgi:uncharacterized protein